MAFGRAGGAQGDASDALRAKGATFTDIAPGAPGAAGTWSYAGKTGVGTSYAPYGPERAASPVWFSIARGVVTETMYGLIHKAQLRQLKFAALLPDGLVLENEGAQCVTEYLDTDAEGRPASLAYRIVNRDLGGRFEIEKHVFTDPDRPCLFVRVIVRASVAVELFLVAEPHMGGTSAGDHADAGLQSLHAFEGRTHLVIQGAAPFTVASAGFLGVSDGETELRRDGRLGGWRTTGETPGSVALAAGLGTVGEGGERTFDVVLGFGSSLLEAAENAQGALAAGYAAVLCAFNGGGGKVGWRDYLLSLKDLPRIARMSGDGGRLAYASALVLKAQEDKIHPGALIASLSTPWGESVASTVEATGYRAVWPRDFYQVASALLALGDVWTPVAALNYLPTVQVLKGTADNRGAVGWFLQKTHVDGAPEWTGVQLDQTAMPIMLADKLHQAGLVTRATLRELWDLSLKPAADFLVAGGRVNFLGDKDHIRPPRTTMERWEEQAGFSPSTTAAEIAGLLAAAHLARTLGEAGDAGRYKAAADAMSQRVEATTFTTCGPYGDGRYFVRIAPKGRPDARDTLTARNGKAGRSQQAYLDAGFLELVRYGLRAADDAAIVSSLAKVDDQSLPHRVRIRYDFRFAGDAGVYPGWRRYSDDGYGEDALTGLGFGSVGPTGRDSPNQRGRVWPLLTGERGHYEIALAAGGHGGAATQDLIRIRDTYALAMERFANSGLMIPEQVYDGVGSGGSAPSPGQGAGSATPLAWSHAEYVKLLRSLADGEVWDRLNPLALDVG